MAAQSPAKTKVTRSQQVCIVCNDIKKTMEAYWNILGIGPWAVFEFGSLRIPGLKYHGQPAWGRERIAHAYVGDLELELVQPVEGDSVYQDWIDERGEGLHHLKFLCDDIDEVSRLLTTQGFTSTQSGHFGDPEEKAGGFNYIKIAPLHCIWEAVHKPKGLPVEPIAHVPSA